jgi:hypothetical protein
MTATFQIDSRENVSEQLFKMEQQVVRLIEQNRQLSRQSQSATREEKQLREQARRVIEETLSPLERYNQRIAELNNLLEKQKISQEVFSRASSRAKSAFDAQDPAQIQARKAAADATAAQKEAEAAAAREAEKATADAAAAKKAADAGAARQAAEARRAQEELAKAAKQVFDQTRTPQEQYEARMTHLNDLVNRGAINLTTYQRAGKQAMDQLNRDTGRTAEEMDEAARKTREAAKAEEELGRAAKQVYEQTRTPQERYKQRLQELNGLLQRGKIDQETYGRAAKKAQDDLASEEEQLARKKSGMGEMVMSLAGMATAYLSVRNAVRLVVNEINAQIEAQKRAKEATLTEAQAEANALVNLGAKTTGERDAFLKRIDAMSSSTGVSKQDLYRRSADALSARGNLSVDQAMAAVEASARLLPGDTEQGKVVSGSALDLMKILQGKGRTIAPEQAIGYMLKVGETARVTDPGKLAENFAPALAAVISSGGTEQEAGALWSALTGAMVDPQGRESKTSSIAFARSLQEFLPEKTTYTYDEKGRRKIQAKGTGLKTLDERVQALRKDSKLREKFFSKASFEMIARTPVEQILSGQGAAADAYDAFLKELPSMETTGGDFQTQASLIQGTEVQRTANFDRSLGAIGDRLRTSNQTGARLAAIRERFIPFLQDAGEGALVSQLRDLDTYGTGYEGFIRQFESRREAVLHPKEWVAGTSPGIGAPAGYFGDRPTTPAEERTAALLGEMIKLMTEMRDHEKESLDEQRKGNRSGPAAAEAQLSVGKER